MRPSSAAGTTGDARPAPSEPPTPSLVVVGNGASGTLVVIALLRAARATGSRLRLTWIGDGVAARGVAYATPERRHRLNVPAATLSLDAADHDFPSWLEARGLHEEEPARRDDEFASRWAFGSYLAETLRDTRAAADPARVTVEVVEDRATAAGSDDDGVWVDLAGGRRVHGDRAVLALGPPGSPTVPGATDAALAHPALVRDPWSDPAGAPGADSARGGTVVLVGTGLTAVDVALSLSRRDPEVGLLAVSRSGWLPRPHSPRPGTPLDPVVRPDPGLTLDAALAAISDHVARDPQNWRDVVDGLRAVTGELWRSLTPADRKRFLADHRRRWEVHRHRMAPSVAAEIHDLVTAGRLSVRAAAVRGIEADGPRLRVRLGVPDDGPDEVVAADRVIACTGAAEDVTAVDDPLVASLLRSGAARPHPLGLGFDTGDDGALRPASGPARFHTLGALRRGELYETTAIPEIRDQADALAQHLLTARDPAR